MKVQTYTLNDTAHVTAYILDSQISYGVHRKRPAMIICPGGGYLTLATKEGEAVATSFLSQGYHCFVLRYSTYHLERVTSLEETPIINPKARYPQPILELMQTMLLLHEHAQEWHLDDDNIFVTGFSAGGHLAASLGVHWDNPDFHQILEQDFEPEDLKPKGLVLAYPLLEGHGGDYIAKNTPKEHLIAHQLADMSDFFFQTQEPSQVQKEAVSILPFINEKTPPTFLWITGQDQIVDPRACLVYAMKMQELGLDCECHLFNNGPHGLARTDKVYAKSSTEVNPPVGVWIEMALTWLDGQMEKNHEY